MVKEAKKMLRPEFVKNQDVIVSFASFHNYKSILLGYYLSKKYSKKWVIYSVDAIPAPIGWEKPGLFHKNTISFISKYINQCDAYFASNQQMLDYQLSLLDGFSNPSGVIYTPIRSDFKYTGCNCYNNDPVLLYTGGIYGPRKKEAFLDGFRIFLKTYPRAKVVFVGEYSMNSFTLYSDLIESGNIEFYGYTHDLSKFYDNASVLIDINAYFNNDVYLSSKIINYLPLKKPILSITGLNSPSRNLFKHDDSIVHCLHIPEQIADSLSRIVSLKDIDFTQRTQYVEMFHANNVIRDFVKIITDL